MNPLFCSRKLMQLCSEYFEYLSKTTIPKSISTALTLVAALTNTLVFIRLSLFVLKILELLNHKLSLKSSII